MVNAPTLSINDVSVNENAGTATFTVTLSGSTSVYPVTVAYATANGTAMQPGDYTMMNGVPTFDVGETMKTIIVPINDDNIYEGTTAETYTVNLSSPTNATISDGIGDGSIVDNDSAPTLSIANTTPGAEPGTDNVFTVTLSGNTALLVTVNYATGGGSATAGSDYGTATPPSPLTFAANGPATQTATITVPTLDDNLFEVTEDFMVTLSGATNATITTATATGTIADNEMQPTVHFATAPASYSITEGGTAATVTVTRDGALGNTVSVNYGVGTCVNNPTPPEVRCAVAGDYTLGGTGTLTFNPSETY